MIYLKADTRALTRNLTRMARDQVPFAAALTANALAARVVKAETEELSDAFEAPRAFTKSAWTTSSTFGGMTATKRLPIAIVVAKPIQAAYFAPSAFHEPQSLGSGKRIRTPVDVKTDSGGNLPKGKLAQLLAEPDCFLGVVAGINGVWQRPTPSRPKNAPRGPRRKVKPNNSGRLRLLVAFTRPKHIKSQLPFRDVASRIVERDTAAVFAASLAQARASAR